MHPHYGSAVPRDHGIAAAQLYYGQTTRGMKSSFYDKSYGFGTTGMYDHRTHLTAPPPHIAQSHIDPARAAILMSADAALPRSHLQTIRGEQYLRPSDVRDERYMSLHSAQLGRPVTSDSSRMLTAGQRRYQEVARNKVGVNMVHNVGISPRSFI
jgi:hypothetical protein